MGNFRFWTENAFSPKRREAKKILVLNTKFLKIIIIKFLSSGSISSNGIAITNFKIFNKKEKKIAFPNLLNRYQLNRSTGQFQ